MLHQKRKKTNPDTVIILAGSTGSGKSAICETLESDIFEVISFDSRQIYKHIPISSAQVDPEILKRVPHHLTSILEPDQIINAADYSKLALNAMRLIQSKNKIPILTSGTGFYLKAFLFGMYPVPEISIQIKEKISLLSQDAKWKSLMSFDRSLSEKLNPNDDYRVSRALEIFESGVDYSKMDSLKEGGFLKDFKGNLFGFFLDIDRLELYKNINGRCQSMLDNGYIEEVRAIVSQYGKDCNAFKTLGFNFALDYMNGGKTMETFFQEFTQSHRNYAKKQVTWFKKDTMLKKVNWNTALKEIQNIEKWFKDVYKK
jgi:tRNA dimethylallyltransferase